MVNKKKRGSSILLVLMVATVMIIISSVVASSLVSTTRMNTVEKREDDISYAAEAGIEQVLSNARKGNYGSLVVGDYITPFNLNTTFISQEIEVEVTGIVVDVAGKKTIHATSIAKDNRNGATKEVQGMITEDRVVSGGHSSLLKYNICANNLIIHSASALNGDMASLNGSNSFILDVAGQVSSGTVNSNDAINVPKFNEGKVPMTSLPIVINNAIELGNLPSTKDSLLYKGALKLEYTNSYTNSKMKVIFANTPNLIIDLSALGNDGTGYNTIVFSSGNITITNTNLLDRKIDRQTGSPITTPIDFYTELTGGLNMSRTTFAAETITMYTSGSIAASFPTYGPDANNPIHTSDQLTEIDTFIRQYMDSSWTGGLGGTATVSYEITDIIYP